MGRGYTGKIEILLGHPGVKSILEKDTIFLQLIGSGKSSELLQTPFESAGLMSPAIVRSHARGERGSKPVSMKQSSRQ